MKDVLASLPFPFRSVLDQRIALEGPAALFTLDARGQLQLEPARTRESWDRLEDILASTRLVACPCLFRDRHTGWVQFILATSIDLCVQHPRAEVRTFEETDEALRVLQSLGNPPVVRDSEVWSTLPGTPV